LDIINYTKFSGDRCNVHTCLQKASDISKYASMIYIKMTKANILQFLIIQEPDCGNVM